MRRIRFRLGIKGGQENDDEWGLRKTDGGGGIPMNFLLIDDYAPAPLPRAYLRLGRVSLSVTKTAKRTCILTCLFANTRCEEFRHK